MAFPATHSAPFRGRLVSVVLVLLVGLLCQSAQAQTTSLRGFVTNAESGEALIDANVLLANPDGSLVTATSTGEEGYYQLRAVASGTYVFRVTFVGFQTYTDTVAVSGGEPLVTKSVSLEPTSRQLDEVTVEAKGGAAKVEAGKQRVRVADVDRIPTPSISGDVASYLQSQPGVVSIGDRGGQLFVRGGTPSQNLVLMDGALVYNPFHLIGFYSVFSDDLVSTADFYAGGFGAEYTDRISSVLDVTMRPGNKKTFRAAASASPFLTEVRVEGPIIEDSFSFIASTRHSVIEETAPQYLSSDVPLRFNDVYVKLHDTGESSQCGLTGLRTFDRGRVDPESDDVIQTENLSLGGRCVLVVPQTSQLVDLTAGVSRYENLTGEADDPSREASIFRYYTNVDVTVPVGNVDVSYGGGVKINRYRYNVGSLFGVLNNAEDEVFTFDGYAGVDFDLGSRLSVEPSVALVYPTTVGMSIEPRVRSTLALGASDATSINVAAGLYRQTFEGISDERDAGSVFTAWVPAPVNDKRAEALHGVLGVTHEFGGGVNLTVEGYYKRLRNLPVPKWSVLARFTTETTLAEGDAYGADIRLEYAPTGSFYGFVGYGYGVVEYRASQDDFGTWFGGGVQSYNPPHDQRHRVNALASWDLSFATANVAWQFSTGLPYTQLIGFDSVLDLRELRESPERDFGSPRAIYDRPYDDRLPVYHRLDVSLERTVEVGLADLTGQLGAINAYDRSNVFYVDLFELRRVNQLPIVPYVALRMELN